jgi:predicted peroxiredoxin
MTKSTIVAINCGVINSESINIKIKPMKKFFLFVFFGLSLLMVSCDPIPKKVASDDVPQGSSSPVVTPVRDGVFIHITQCYNDPHRVLMPLKMAVMMSNDKDVLVYMDIHAVELLVKDARDLEMEGFESAHTYIKELIAKQVGVYACPTCLKIAGFNPEDLMEGVQTAQKDKFFDFTKGRIITLDY